VLRASVAQNAKMNMQHKWLNLDFDDGITESIIESCSQEDKFSLF
jgi:hypothetical protein